MNLYRNILSLFLLSTYALLLLHDFIPHAHYGQGAEVQGFFAIHQHSQDGHQHHGHSHQEEDGKKEEAPVSSEKEAMGDYLIHSHNHSEKNGPHYELTYIPAAKDNWVPQANASAVLCWAADSWKLPPKLRSNNFWQFATLPPPLDSPHSFGHGLRAPPALG